MRQPSDKRIFARVAAADFVGRQAQLEQLLSHAKAQSGSTGLVVLAAPAAGASELLRQIYDRLFFEQKDVVPFYFELRTADLSGRNAALRFLREFLVQTVAFRRSDANIIAVSPDVCEISELAGPEDSRWIDRMIETCRSSSELNDDRSLVHNCLSAPLRAAVSGTRAFVIIDDVHVAAHLDGGEMFLEDIKDIFGRSDIPFVIAGHRRFLFAKTQFETLTVEPLSLIEAGEFVQSLAARMRVAINDQTRDLISVQLGGNAGYISSLIASAAAGGDDLNSFEHFQRVYTDEIFGGRIGKSLERSIARIVPEAASQSRVLRLLSENITARDSTIPLSYWKKHAGLEDHEFHATLDVLDCHEVINLRADLIEIDAANLVLRDYIRGRSRVEIEGEPRALAIGKSLSENVKRAPQLMARSYRRNSALGLRELLKEFDGREVSSALFDYARFKNEFKGADNEKLLKALETDNSKIILPRIVYTANTAAIYPALNEVCDSERSAVALGFSSADDQEETAWIAAEIDSKLEASAELTELWCEHLETVAAASKFKKYRLWLVAPEGFAPDAIDVLRGRSAYASSRKQVELFTAILGADLRLGVEKTANEYEIVVPMGDDTEMIVAHTVEDIARRHNFPTKAINQIKTALVEASINAAEHSLSPDRKICQKLVVDADRITITVSNRGVRLTDRSVDENTHDKSRRGWGLKLIKGLMDEVTVEQTDDGTRITMVKYLKVA